jgi:hypothetical protein
VSLGILRSSTAGRTLDRSVGLAPRLLVGQPCYLGSISEPVRGFPALKLRPLTALFCVGAGVKQPGREACHLPVSVLIGSSATLRSGSKCYFT